MTTTAQRTQHLFLVRMWQETDAVTAVPQWRGSVKHVLSEQSHYFARLPDLLTFIATITASSDTSDPMATTDTLPSQLELTQET
ncbi:MAG: hypothetical protein R3E79_31600 [Caldilineaceae bacterium]